MLRKISLALIFLGHMGWGSFTEQDRIDIRKITPRQWQFVTNSHAIPGANNLLQALLVQGIIDGPPPITFFASTAFYNNPSLVLTFDQLAVGFRAELPADVFFSAPNSVPALRPMDRKSIASYSVPQLEAACSLGVFNDPGDGSSFLVPFSQTLRTFLHTMNASYEGPSGTVHAALIVIDADYLIQPPHPHSGEIYGISNLSQIYNAFAHGAIAS